MTAGRICPLNYRINLKDIKESTSTSCETIYIIGGLYGNWAALNTILQRKRQEEAENNSTITLLFNGDFNWLNSTRETFKSINQEVFKHLALKGNVECEIATPTQGAGCGCAYPDSILDQTVTHSNNIIKKLQKIAAYNQEIIAKLAELPSFLNVSVGELKITALHGDPDSIAGWGLGIDAMPPIGQNSKCISSWFTQTEADVFSCSHTCLPFIQDFDDRLVVNNGSAGMPNFKKNLSGIITRISTYKTNLPTLYGTKLKDCYIDAIAIDWNSEWDDWFIQHWPSGSPASSSYYSRFIDGPDFTIAQANRLNTTKKI